MSTERFLIKVKRPTNVAPGVSAPVLIHSQDGSVVAAIDDPEPIEAIQGLMGHSVEEFMWAAIDEDGGLLMDLDALAPRQEW